MYEGSSWLPSKLAYVKYALLFMLIAAVFLFLSPHAKAADRYWVGTRNNDSDRWEDTENWSAVPRGASGASVPGANDVAIFSFSGNTVRIRSAATVGGIVLSNVWTGSVLQGTGVIAVKNTSTGIRVGSGRLIGGSAAITMTGSFVMTGGIVSNINGTMTMSGNLSITNGGGTGIPNPSFTATGTIVFDGASADQTVTKGSSTSAQFGSITLQKSAGGSDDDLIVSGNMNMSGALTVTQGNFDLDSNNATLNVERGITIADDAQATFVADANVTASGSIAVGAAGRFHMSGSTTLTLNGHSQNLDTNNTPMYNLVINSSDGTTLNSAGSITNAITIAASSSFILNGYVLYATGATIANSGTITEGTGAIKHASASFMTADSGYSAKTSFVAGADRVYVTIVDLDENIDATALDTLTVTGSLAGGADTETLLLTETTVTSGIFRASWPTALHNSPTAGNGVLELATSSNALSVSYVDVQDGLTDSASATLNVPSTVSSGSSGGSSGGGGGGSRRLPSTALAPQGEQTSDGATSSEEGGGTGDRGERLSISVDGTMVTFTDLYTNDWFTPFVQSLLGKNIVSGYRDALGNPTGEYGPANSVTYAEIAKMALGAAGQQISGRTPQNTSAQGQWSAGYIAAMEEAGVSVFANASLNVNSPATRGAVVQTILEIFGVPIGSPTGSVYGDVSVSTENAGAIEQATEDGMVSGDDGKDTFRPRDSVNRAETAKIVDNAMTIYGQ